ncbi:MAG: alpha/beta hydrolase [Marmoricola sp.]
MLYPQSRAALAAEEGETPLSDPSVDESAIRERREQARREAAAEPREDVAEVRDADADGVRVRVYRPGFRGSTSSTTPTSGGERATSASGERLPAVVHLHGGGFVFGDIDIHDAACRRLANRSGLAVVSVDYRRPPEHRFPDAPDDVDTVLSWLVREGERHGLDPDRLLVHGDSAGGNLALVAALRHPDLFRGLALTYPFIDAHQRGASYDEAPGTFGREVAAWYWRQYAAPEDYDDPDVSPLDSPDLQTLPPTLVVTAEHDPLRDEGEQLAARIAEAGGSVVATRYLGMLHGFWRRPEGFDAAEPLTRQIAGFLVQYA